MELVDKLKQSDSYKSNTLEKQVANVISKYNWDVNRSPYYSDPVTKKLRELDIKANFKYTTENQDDIKKHRIIEYNLLLECKSLKSYHILLDSKISARSKLLDSHHIWSGNDSYERFGNFKEILVRSDIKRSFIPQILDNLTDLFFPENNSVVYDHMKAPMEIDSFCSFRETNIGSEKELDNSVVWKAFHELQSVIKSEKNRLFENIESDFRGGLPGHNISYKNREIIYVCNDLFKDWGKIRQLKTVHPILVVDCKLWDINSEDDVIPLKWARLLVNGMMGYNMFWFDIVDVKHIDEYIELISKHYLNDVYLEGRFII